MKKNILYIARAGLPIDAAGIRINNIADLLIQNGNRIVFLCDKQYNENSSLSSKTSAEQCEFDNNLIQVNYNSCKYFYQNEIGNYSKKDAIVEILQTISAFKIYKQACSICNRYNIDTIILYNDVYYLTKKLIPHCKRKGIKLIADVTEWYQFNRKDTFLEKLISIFVNRRIKHVDQKLDGVITISPFLTDYYSKKRVKCEFVPPVIEIQDDLIIKKHDYELLDVVNIVYAGSPKSKDILLPVIEAIKAINSNEVKIRFDIIGISEEYVTNMGFPHDQKLFGIFVHGCLSHEATIEIVRNADFSILIRRPERYAKAGFSTKFAECMSNGVAMICNSVGGADIIIENEVDGFVIKDDLIQSIEEILRKMISLKEDEIIDIRQAAFEKAKKIFDGKNYVDSLCRLIQ